jgi:hypothetical protein
VGQLPSGSLMSFFPCKAMTRGVSAQARAPAIAGDGEGREIRGEKRLGEQYGASRLPCGLLLAPGAYPFIDAD